jgi:hypothetical protein
VAEVRRRIRATMVPTADADVRRLLRQVEQPVTLFGEREVRSPAAPAARQGRLSSEVLVSCCRRRPACLAGAASGALGAADKVPVFLSHPPNVTKLCQPLAVGALVWAPAQRQPRRQSFAAVHC